MINIKIMEKSFGILYSVLKLVRVGEEMNSNGIASLSTELSVCKMMTDVSLSVMKKGMENEEAVGNQMIQMMERSVNPALGANVDVKL